MALKLYTKRDLSNMIEVCNKARSLIKDKEIQIQLIDIAGLLNELKRGSNHGI